MSDTVEELTTADLLIEALVDCGISYIFANLGSDHPSLIEAIAKRHNEGKTTPQVLLCPHETTALSAAHGYAAITGRPQAVFVHTDVGTANLGGSLHNASRSHIPVLILAGLTPFTLENEAVGSRSIHANYLQDVPNQHDIVRPYVKWGYDIRTGDNVKQIVYRAIQLSTSAPQGPVYLTAARETLAAEACRPDHTFEEWPPIAPCPAPRNVVKELLNAITKAKFPILVTTYVGKNPQCVPLLVEIAEKLGMGIVETVPYQMNFPGDHDLHLGYTVDDVMSDADLILALDTDVPWMQSKTHPRSECSIYFIGDDPLKEFLPLWYYPATQFIRADSETFLHQILEETGSTSRDTDRFAERIALFTRIHSEQRAQWNRQGASNASQASEITAELVCSTVHELIDDQTVIIDETITNRTAMSQHIPRTTPGTLFGNGGTALGWSGGAAIGAKLAKPDATVVALIGDGSFYLGVPSSTYWMAKQYQLPFLAIILNNGGWNATKLNLLGQYAGGSADLTDQYLVNLHQFADLAGAAHEIGGAHPYTVTRAIELGPIIREALNHTKNGELAVVEVRMNQISHQNNQTETTH